MSRRWALALAVSSFLLCGYIFAQQKSDSNSQNTRMNSVDRTFVTKAAEANLAEIDSAKVVEREAKDPAVKDFASRMIGDHTQANQKLAKIAETALPSQSSEAERSQQSELQKLSGGKLDQHVLSG